MKQVTDYILYGKKILVNRHREDFEFGLLDIIFNEPYPNTGSKHIKVLLLTEDHRNDFDKIFNQVDVEFGWLYSKNTQEEINGYCKHAKNRTQSLSRNWIVSIAFWQQYDQYSGGYDLKRDIMHILRYDVIEAIKLAVEKQHIVIKSEKYPATLDDNELLKFFDFVKVK